jgi:hypothetical protein
MATQDTQIRLYREPRSILFDRVLAEPATALLTFGIVNPMGPTLTTVLALGSLKGGHKLPVIRVMLNPFSQEAEALGELALGGKWKPAAVIRPLLGLPFGSCPTVLLPSVHLNTSPPKGT